MKNNDGTGDCRFCGWWNWDNDGLCHNEGAEYMERMDADNGCTLCDYEDEDTDHSKYDSMEIDGCPVQQILLPDINDNDPHPRLMFKGYGIHAGDCFTAWLPDGWHEIRLEVSWDNTGASCWYIATEKLYHVCPVGLFCKV